MPKPIVSLLTPELRLSLTGAVARTMIDQITALPRGPLECCRSFAELHDHCDANCLGGGELLHHWLGQEECLKVLNEAQEVVDEWLKVHPYKRANDIMDVEVDE